MAEGITTILGSGTIIRFKWAKTLSGLTGCKKEKPPEGRLFGYNYDVTLETISCSSCSERKPLEAPDSPIL